MNKYKLFIRITTSAMLIAMVFGIVAFVKANKNGELKNLYKELPQKEIDKENSIEVEDFSRGIISPPPIEMDSVTVNKSAVNTDILTKENIEEKKLVNKKTTTRKKKNKIKIISYKSFSRGAIEEPKRSIIIDTIK
jgi:hypothetical protein